MENLKITADPNNQFSSFLLDNLKPIQMRPHWDLSLKIDFYIQPLIQTIDFISKLGDLEHTGDWDPYLVIETTEEEIETDSGYYDMEIQGTVLRILQEGGYMTIPISKIISITILR